MGVLRQTRDEMASNKMIVFYAHTRTYEYDGFEYQAYIVWYLIMCYVVTIQ